MRQFLSTLPRTAYETSPRGVRAAARKGTFPARCRETVAAYALTSWSPQFMENSSFLGSRRRSDTLAIFAWAFLRSQRRQSLVHLGMSSLGSEASILDFSRRSFSSDLGVALAPRNLTRRPM